MHAVMRRYRVRLGTVRQAVRHAEDQFLPLVRRLPGFAACYLLDAGEGVMTSIGLFHTAEGAAAAVRLHREWFRDEWSSFLLLPPEVSGEVLAQAGRELALDGERYLPGRPPVERRQSLVSGATSRDVTG